MIDKHTLSCCALCQITANNRDTVDDLKEKIDQLRTEAKIGYKQGTRHGEGQRAAFVIVAPHEHELEQNLLKLNFELIAKFNRRVGYAPGMLKMYFLNW